MANKMSHHVIREMEDGNYTMEHHSAPKRIKGGMGYEHEEPKTHVMGSECEHCGPIKAAMMKHEEEEDESE